MKTSRVLNLRDSLLDRIKEKVVCCRKKKSELMSLDALEKVMPDTMKDKISDNRNTFVMRVCSLCLTTNIIFQLGEF